MSTRESCSDSSSESDIGIKKTQNVSVETNIFYLVLSLHPQRHIHNLVKNLKWSYFWK